MKPNIARTLMLTTSCSASCRHCPFADERMPKEDLSLENLKRALKEAPNELVVISGGEPFEYKDPAGLSRTLMASPAPFRIATGGFVDLAPHLKDLCKMRNLNGISLGTDVLTLRSTDAEHKNIWRLNVDRLNEAKIPYSMTLSISDDMGDLDGILKFMIKADARPEFIYIRWMQIGDKEGQRALITRYFPVAPTIEDEIAICVP